MHRVAVPAVAQCTALGLSAAVGATADGHGPGPRGGPSVLPAPHNATGPGEGGNAEGSLAGGATTARSPIGPRLLGPRADETPTRTAAVTADATPGTGRTPPSGCTSNTDRIAEATVTTARRRHPGDVRRWPDRGRAQRRRGAVEPVPGLPGR